MFLLPGLQVWLSLVASLILMACLLTALTRIRKYLLFTPVTTIPSRTFTTTSTHKKPSHTINPSSKHPSSIMSLHSSFSSNKHSHASATTKPSRPSSTSSYPFTMSSSSSSTTLGAFCFNLFRAIVNQDTRRLPTDLALRLGLFSWFFFCLMVYGRRHCRRFSVSPLS